MNNRTRSSQVQQIRKNPLSRENEDKVGMQGTRSSSSEKATTSGRQATREKKLALLQDVDKLKKKLRDEENIHRALERAFNRPLGSLPRLPPYLPPNTLELLAEIAVLEEEVVRLEEQVVSCRQNLYQEAGYICSKRKLENPVDYYEQILSRVSKEEQSDQVKSPVSVARTPSSSSEIVSDRSSLSLGNTASGSSDVVSDQTVQSSNDLAKQKQPVEEPASIVGSGESGKVIGNQTSTSSNKKSDMVSHLTEETSSGLMNREQAMDEVNSTADSWENRKAKGKHSNGLMNGRLTSSDFGSSPKPNKNRKGKDDHTLSISTRKTQLTEKKFSTVKSPARMPSSKRQPSQKSVNSPMKQTESKTLEEDNEANKISEDMLKCLCSIFIRMSTANDRRNQIDTLPYPLSLGSSQIGKETKIQDPYGSVAEFKERDIGLYKDLSVVDAKSIDLRRKKSALFLLHKLKLLLGKLARVKLDGLTHQHKLAFWINTYHSCLMNAFLEQGIPDSPEKVVSLAREATIVVAGQKLKAVTIEHFILRSPFYLKHGNKKAAKGEELNMFGLECTEPLVTFALSCGSWSSPAVRIYTASQVESELEAAKIEYLQAAVGISMSNKMVIPKLLEWHQLDFGKDFESLLDWVCLQLPDEIRKEALLCLQRKGKQPLQELVEVVPYDFTFRYLIIHS